MCGVCVLKGVGGGGSRYLWRSAEHMLGVEGVGVSRRGWGAKVVRWGTPYPSEYKTDPREHTDASVEGARM